MIKKVFVSGSFDMLHSGHVAFFQEASTLGDLYVGVGSSKTIEELKARKTINTDEERLYMVSSIKYVKDAWVSSGSGLLDFETELRALQPDIFFVNEDGQTPLKVDLCKELGIELIVSERIPAANLPKRSTTALREECTIPYRIDMAGGWLDQPEVSKHADGAVITISIEPNYDFNDRAGVSTSTRRCAIDLWQTSIPSGDREKLARTLFCYENPPGSKYVSGSQDSLGIVMPGINYLHYSKGDYWPSSIKSKVDNDTIDWLESKLCMLPLTPRSAGTNVLDGSHPNPESAERLADASSALWQALLKKDSEGLGAAMIQSFEAQVEMFPAMLNDEIKKEILNIKDHCLGYKMCGAGGGGYILLFDYSGDNKTLSINIRR